MRVPDVIILLLIGLILFLVKKIFELSKKHDEIFQQNQKFASEVYKIKNEVREKTTEMTAKTTQKTVKQSTLFLKIKKIVSSLDPQDICSTLFELLEKELGATKSCILLAETKTKIFRVLASKGMSGDEERKVAVTSHEQSLIGLAIRSNMLIDINSIEKEQTFSALIGRGQLKTFMAAPVHYSKTGEIMGILNICEMDSINYTSDDKNLFNMVASILEVALNNSLLYENQLEESEKRALETEKIKEIFGKYVSSQILDEILNSPESLELGGSNRRITVLASDIRGFTKLSEMLKPQEMVAMLNDYFSVMTEIVNMNHGTVDKFIGDAMMVLFGAPVATENDVFNSVRTALEMQDAIKVFEDKWRDIRGENWTFNIGIGISNGEVVVGNIGSTTRMEYTAIGDNVNVAFRLESIAPGGTVLITESVFSEIKDRVNVEKMQPVTVKGREQPVQVYKLLGLKT